MKCDETITLLQMGVKYLNKFLIQKCPSAITLTKMSELRNKVLVVDTNIYLYKFSMGNSLIENMYLMLSLFEQYQITPIFIFDGKPPTEKKKLIDRRYREKSVAEKEYEELSQKLENNQISNSKRKDIVNKLNLLKRKCVCITKNDIQEVQHLISSYGFTYMQAPHEADELCSLFVKSGKAWACISEDMDLLVHGTPRVLRYLSLINQSFVLYDTSQILFELRITQTEFMQICVLSGTDYNLDIHNNIEELFTLFYKFKDDCKCKNKNKKTMQPDFISWLRETSQCSDSNIQVDTEDSLEKSINMFLQPCKLCKEIVTEATCFRHQKNICKVQNILEQDGFVYPQTIKCCA